jgi:hypothetical protein
MRPYFVTVAKQGSLYKCVEKATNHVIKCYSDYNSANAKCEFWNNGGGFAGFSPAFICAEPFLPIIVRESNYTFSIED